MKEIILYGAGTNGKKVAQILWKHGIQIAGFCDSMKTGDVIWGKESRKSAILDLNSIDNYKYVVLITICDGNAAAEVKEKLVERKIEITTVEQLLYPDGNEVSRNRNYIAEYHVEEMDDYFKRAEQSEYMLF